MADILLLLFLVFGPGGILFLLGLVGTCRISTGKVSERRLILENIGVSLFLVTCVWLVFFNIEVSMTAGEGFYWAALYSFMANIILVPSLNVIFSILFILIGYFRKRGLESLPA